MGARELESRARASLARARVWRRRGTRSQVYSVTFASYVGDVPPVELDLPVADHHIAAASASVSEIVKGSWGVVKASESAVSAAPWVNEQRETSVRKARRKCSPRRGEEVDARDALRACGRDWDLISPTS